MTGEEGVCVFFFNGTVTNERLGLQIDARLRLSVDYNTVVWCGF